MKYFVSFSLIVFSLVVLYLVISGKADRLLVILLNTIKVANVAAPGAGATQSPAAFPGVPTTVPSLQQAFYKLGLPSTGLYQPPFANMYFPNVNMPPMVS